MRTTPLVGRTTSRATVRPVVVGGLPCCRPHRRNCSLDARRQRRRPRAPWLTETPSAPAGPHPRAQRHRPRRCGESRLLLLLDGSWRVDFLISPSPLHPIPQDKEKVLSEVRGIIAQQLGVDLEKVRASGAVHSLGCFKEMMCGCGCLTVNVSWHIANSAHACRPQVASDSKFVDLGADSLDTVSLGLGTALQVRSRRSAPTLTIVLIPALRSRS